MDEKQEVVKMAKSLLESYFSKGQVEYLISTFADDIVWLGGGKHQKAEGKAEVAEWFRQGQSEVTPCNMTNEEYEYRKLAPDCYLCEARSDLQSRKGSKVLLNMHQRCTFIFKRINGVLKTVHIHNSMPYEALEESELFPEQYGKEQYERLLNEYMVQKEKNLRDSELVYLAMKDTAICDYSYSPRTKSIDIPEYMAKRYGWKTHYDNMPHSFAAAHIDENTRADFCEMYFAVDRGEPFAKCDFQVLNTDIWVRNSMSCIEHDKSGAASIVVGIVEDITLSKKTETEYSRMIDALGAMYSANYYCDMHTDTYKALKQLPHMKQYIDQEGCCSKAIYDYAQQFVVPDDRDVLLRKFERNYIVSHLSMKNRSVSMEYRRIFGNGVRWCRLQAILSDLDQDNQPHHFILVFQDIDDEKKERELKDTSLELLRDAYYRIGCIDLNKNSMATIKVAGEEYSEARQYEMNFRQAILEFASSRVAPEYRETFCSIMLPEHLKEIFDDGAQYAEFTYQRLVAGEYRWVRSEIVPMQFYDSDNARVMWYVKNISEEKAKEAELSQQLLESNAELKLSLQSEEQYRQAILSEAVVTYQINVSKDLIEHDIIQKIGGKTVSLLPLLDFEAPCSYEEFCTKWKTRYVTEDTKDAYAAAGNCAAMLDSFRAGKKVITVEYKAQSAPGAKETFMQKIILLTQAELSDDILGLCYEKDITAIREQEYQTKIALQDAYEAANRANQAKSDFLSRMSHDIRTPMNAIIGMTAIAGTHLDDSERVMNCLNKITVSSKHLLSLINEVLDMSKIESGKVDLSEEEFNLSDLIDNLLSMVRPAIEEKYHQLMVNIKNLEHEKVIGDSLRIQQAFVNLMSNAIKYTPDGGNINLSISEKATNRIGIGCYEFVFEDNGIGMKPDFVEHLFEPFVRAEDSHVNNIQGTGLGMAITRNVVRMMDGDIKVESTYGKGSRFTVTIYLKLQDSEDLSCDEFIDLPVLVADDEQSCCESTCSILNGLGMKSQWVLTGEEAVEQVVQAHEAGSDFFAVILDWKMPGMDGVATTKEIRKQVGPDVPIIIFSAYDWSDIELEARAAGADAFISKPLFRSRLARVFRDLVGENDKNDTASLRSLSEHNFEGKRVLLVEDNELNREIATEILQAAGLAVEMAKNGREAVDMVTTLPANYYDMVFMDIQMPVMNGYEATVAIRAMNRKDLKTLPIVAMTANAFAEDVQNARNSGMNEHIAKPLDLKQLNNTLKKWLE